MFPSPQGKALRRTHFRIPLLDAGGPGLGPRALPFHSLRHSHAAFLIEEGVHAKAIQARLGHADIRTTPQLYGHLFEGYAETAAEAMDAAVRGQDADTKPVGNVVPFDRPT